MELVKDIYFNTDKLIENTKVKVSYTGKFYQGDNDKVYIHYGYGENWDNINEVEMEKTDLGYQTELTLAGGDTLNFCFKNQNNEWDNNFEKNYVFNIEKIATNDLGTTTVGTTDDVVYWSKDLGKKDALDEAQKVYSTFETVNTAAHNILQSVDTVIPNNEITLSEIEDTSSQSTESIAGTDVTNVVENAISANKINAVNTETAITLAPTGFNYWTKKIKASVCKFFSYVPKFISGNYKRNLSDNKK